ncbi:heme-binding protein [Paucibacter sp. KBW04]|nr:heme-binding protein [Paucibacter sp. KBW04]
MHLARPPARPGAPARSSPERQSRPPQPAPGVDSCPPAAHRPLLASSIMFLVSARPCGLPPVLRRSRLQTRLQTALLSLPLLLATAASQAQSAEAKPAQSAKPGPDAPAAPMQLAPLRVQGQQAQPGVALHPSAAEAAQAPYKQAGSSVHIARETLERFRGTSPADMLKGVAGVQMADVRNGHALDVNIRGIQGQSRVPVVIDGSQQSLEVYRGYAGQQQRSYLDPDLISSVTVEKGPGLSLDGAGAIGGVVNMTSLQVADVLAEGQSQGWRLRGGIADNSVREQQGFSVFNRKERNNIFSPQSYFGTIAYASKSEKLDWLAAYVRRSQGNYFAGTRGAEAYGQSRLDAPGTGMNADPVYTYYRVGEEVLNTHSSNDSVLLKATIRPNADQALELGLRHLSALYGEVMPSAISRTPASSEWVTYVDPENTMQQFEPGQMKLTALTAQHRWQPAGQALIDLKSRLWFTRSDSTMFNAVVGSAPVGRDLPSNQLGDPQGDSYAQALRSNVRGQRWGAQLGNTSLFFLGEGQSLEAKYGLSYTHEKTGPGVDTPVVEADLRNNRFVRSAVRQEASLVGSLEWKPVEALSLLAGGRLLQYEVRDLNRRAHVTETRQVPRRAVHLYKNGQALEYVSWYPDAQGQFTEASLRASPHRLGTLGDLGYDSWKPNGPNNGAYMDSIASAWRYDEPLRRKGSKFAPSFSASYQPSEGSLIYARYAEGFKMPSVFEATVGNHFITPNPDLRPESNRSWELGASGSLRDLWRAQDRLSLKLAYFENRVRDYITRSYDPSSYSFTMSNMERFETAGWELQTAYDNGSFFADVSGTLYTRAQTCDAELAQKLRKARYGKTQATPDCVDGGFGGSYANTQNPPKFALNTSLGVRLLERRLTLGGRVVRNSAPLHRLDKPWNTNAYTTLQQYYPATLIVDAFASYQLNKQTQLNFKVDNLTDRYYLDPLALSPMPAPGRTVRADFSLHF